MSDVLPASFYQRADALVVARDLLGCLLVSEIDGHRTAGRIVETEAYDGRREAATRQHLARRSQQSKMLFAVGGRAYVYKVYRVHRLFNIVTGPADYPAAVLIRAVAPVVGEEAMRARRPKGKLTAGPAMLSQALGIDVGHNGHDLTQRQVLWLEAADAPVPEAAVVAGPRVGIDYAGADAALPWRLALRDDPWVSRPRP